MSFFLSKSTATLLSSRYVLTINEIFHMRYCVSLYLKWHQKYELSNLKTLKKTLFWPRGRLASWSYNWQWCFKFLLQLYDEILCVWNKTCSKSWLILFWNKSCSKSCLSCFWNNTCSNSCWNILFPNLMGKKLLKILLEHNLFQLRLNIAPKCKQTCFEL